MNDRIIKFFVLIGIVCILAGIVMTLSDNGTINFSFLNDDDQTAVEKSRKGLYRIELKQIIEMTRSSLSTGDIVNNDGTGQCQAPSIGNTTSISLVYNGVNSLPALIEKGGDKSPYAKNYKEGYVVIYNQGRENGDYFKYYISLMDEGGNGLPTLIDENILNKDMIKENGKPQASNKLLENGQELPIQFNCHIENE